MLTIVSKRRGRKVLCQCICGVRKEFTYSNVINLKSRSCGCLRNEMTIARSTKHGYRRRGSSSQVYRAWVNMRKRCMDKSRKDWKDYGGRGVTYDSRWNDFVTFLNDVGEPPTNKHQLDRYPDNNGNYQPGNVRWATPVEQGNNTRKNVVIEYNGKKQTISAWAKEIGLDYHALYYRLSNEWSVEKSLTTPSKR